MRNIHDGILYLKIAKDKCPPPLTGPDKTEFKAGDVVLLKNHSPSGHCCDHTSYVLEYITIDLLFVMA